MSNENYLKKLFIDEAKPALQRHSGVGGGAVIPLEVTENGVYDATIGGLKYGQTVTLRRHIPEAEFAAFASRFEERGLSEGEIHMICPPFMMVEWSGLVIIYAITTQGDTAGYIYADLVEALEFPTEYVGEWINVDTMEIVPPEALTVTLSTKEQYESEPWLFSHGEMQFAFNESITNESGLDGYNPVTVNLPNGYGTEEATATEADILEGKTAYANGEKLTGTAPSTSVPVPIFPEDIPYGMTVVANNEKVIGTKFVPSGKIMICTGESVTTAITVGFSPNIYIQVDGGEIEQGKAVSAYARTVTTEDGMEFIGYESVTREITVYNSYQPKSIGGLITGATVGDPGNAVADTMRWTIEELDIRNIEDMSYGFEWGYGRAYVDKISFTHTERVDEIRNTFSTQIFLQSVKGLDLRATTDAVNAFYRCESLTELELKNIRTSLQVGSGIYYGHLLTVDSLVRLIYELRNTGSSKTLTVGSANLEKLASVYVKTVEITDEMRAEDDLVDEKLPFVVCESTDEGATLITDYVGFKNWVIK